MARKIVATGFYPTFGIHHDNQLNAFNLADDLIEPYRAMVDLVAHNNIGSNVLLSKQERQTLAQVLHNACMVEETKVNILSAIEIMVESLKRIILEDSDELLKLPVIIPNKDGYIRIAPEVYMRIVQNRKSSEKHYRRIDEVAPKTGVVRLLRLTEKQYKNIYMVTGTADYQEKTVGINCHIMT